MLVAGRPGIPSEKLRACLRWLDYSRLTEAFDRVADSPAKLVSVWAAVSAGEWDVFADQLTLRQVREAIKGIVPQFKEGPNGLEAVYSKRGKR
jgi:hypothetical protein